MRILVVEDDELILELLDVSLRMLHHEPVLCQTTEDGLRAIAEGRLDGAIVDGMRGDGIRLLADAERHGIPAVLYSGDGALCEEAIRADFAAVGKPARIELLLEAMERKAAVRS